MITTYLRVIWRGYDEQSQRCGVLLKVLIWVGDVKDKGNNQGIAVVVVAVVGSRLLHVVATLNVLYGVVTVY